MARSWMRWRRRSGRDSRPASPGRRRRSRTACARSNATGSIGSLWSPSSQARSTRWRRCCSDGGVLPSSARPGSMLTSAGDEVLGLGVVTDDGRGRLLGLVLPGGILGAAHADAVGVEQLGHLGVVLEVRTGRVAPGVAAAPELLAEQAQQARTVLAAEAPFGPDAGVPVLGQRLGQLHPEAVQEEVVLVAVLGEQPGGCLRHLRAHRDDVEGGVVALR